MLSSTEENYLKAIFKLEEKSDSSVSTNAISQLMETKAASVTDMVKRLSEKGLIIYEKYKGVHMTREGRKVATNLVRKHRLWEVFLVDKLDFNWDQVHEIAEQLEHIRSPLLIRRLEKFLGYPDYDPHGDPIPDEEGKFRYRSQLTLSEVKSGVEAIVVGVEDSSTEFLQFLDKIGIALGSHLTLIESYSYDRSRCVRIDGGEEQLLSEPVCQNLLIKIPKRAEEKADA